MENASKALIIAGSILLAILLISFGIIIIRQGSGIINNSGMSEAEIQAFNERFSKYEGDAVKGNMVKALIQEVNASNTNENNVEIIITLKGPAAGSEDNTYKTSNVKNNESYVVEVTGYTKGRVSEITISGTNMDGE